MGKKPIVFVTYENERISIKKQPTLLKMCYVSPVWSTGEKTVYIKTHKTAISRPVDHLTHILSKVSCFYWNPFISVGYRNDRFFSHTNLYISKVTQLCRLSPMLRFRAGLPVVCNPMQGTWRSTRDMRGKISILFSIKVEIGIFVVEEGNTFQFSLSWLILKALVSIKELEENQENSSSTVMVAFYLRVVA